MNNLEEYKQMNAPMDLQALAMKIVAEEIASDGQLTLADFQFRIESGAAVLVNLKSGAVWSLSTSQYAAGNGMKLN